MASLDTLENDIKYIRESVDEMKVQVKQTNGRVKSLELWKAFMTGGLAVISSILIPIAFRVFL